MGCQADGALISPPAATCTVPGLLTKVVVVLKVASTEYPRLLEVASTSAYSILARSPMSNRDDAHVGGQSIHPPPLPNANPGVVTGPLRLGQSTASRHHNVVKVVWTMGGRFIMTMHRCTPAQTRRSQVERPDERPDRLCCLPGGEGEERKDMYSQPARGEVDRWNHPTYPISYSKYATVGDEARRVVMTILSKLIPDCMTLCRNGDRSQAHLIYSRLTVPFQHRCGQRLINP